jgi:hypothetical protein
VSVDGREKSWEDSLVRCAPTTLSRGRSVRHSKSYSFETLTCWFEMSTSGPLAPSSPDIWSRRFRDGTHPRPLREIRALVMAALNRRRLRARRRLSDG